MERRQSRALIRRKTSSRRRVASSSTSVRACPFRIRAVHARPSTGHSGTQLWTRPRPGSGEKYATFTGRASRSEFWLALLVASVSLFVVGIVVPVALPLLPEMAYRVVSLVLFLVLNGYAIALIVPLLAVTWRRLHDVNSSGGLFFFGLIPLIGPIMLLINLAGVQDPDGARFDKPGFTGASGQIEL